MRALMIVATLFFGFGAALYAMGWFLIPDVRSGQILAEDLIEGQWDWNCLGCFLFMAVADCAKRCSSAGRIRFRVPRWSVHRAAE